MAHVKDMDERLAALQSGEIASGAGKRTPMQEVLPLTAGSTDTAAKPRNEEQV